MRKSLVAVLLLLFSLPLVAEEEQLQEGFLTGIINDRVERAVEKHADADTLQYGRDVTKWASVPKLGGYFIGSYKYSDQTGSHGGDGFGLRLVRVYVDGTLLRDFKYRLQVELNGTPHVKDFYLDWMHWKELGVKVGQFKRCFTFENPMNPWDVGIGDYGLAPKKLAGFNDYCGESSVGGRDLGIQLHGDVLPVGKDQHRLFHYEAGVYNGQGINTKDANGHKDLIGTLQVQPIKGLYLGVFGWKGDYTKGNITVERNRYAVGARYDNKGWSARAEYAHNSGRKLSDYNTDGTLKTVHSNGRADAWYATLGVPCTKWLKVYVRYDAYRDGACNSALKSIYTIAPNFQLHKNLMLQLQYNWNCDKTASRDQHWNDIWTQIYVRF